MAVEHTVRIKHIIENVKENLSQKFDFSGGGFDLSAGIKKGLKGLGIVSAIMLIARAIMGLKPVVLILDMINKVIQLFFLPFVMMLFRLLKPVLVFLMKLMMLWYQFWQNPKQKIKDWFGIKEDQPASTGGVIGSALINKLNKLFGTNTEDDSKTPKEKFSDFIGQFTGMLIDLITLNFPAVFERIHNIIEKFNLTDEFELIKNKIKEYGKKFVTEGLGGAINTFISDFNSFWSENKDKLSGLITDFKNKLYEKLLEKKDKLVDFTTKIKEKVYEKLTEKVDAIKNFALELLGWIFENIDQGANELKKLGGMIKDWAYKTIINPAKETASNIISSARSMYNNIKERLSTGNKETTEHTTDAIITPSGRVIKTAPDDYITASKSPGNRTFNISINVDSSKEDLANEIMRKLTHELRAYDRW